MPNNFICVPIKIQGLILDNDQMTSSPLADFSKLPWNDGDKDINYSQPFISDGIIHHPFSDNNMLLPAGLHLHFILPHFLGQQVPKNAKTDYTNQLPPAPNKWLVSNGTDTWVIESDYIHKEKYEPIDPTCVIPFPSNAQNQGVPYRYMGRRTELSDPRPSGTTFKSLNKSQKPLTAIGYGDMKFSSFYPSCVGVFGCFDEKFKISEGEKTYQVIGWNEHESDDILLKSVTEYLAQPKDSNGASLQEFIKNNFKIDIGDLESIPANRRTLYTGQIKINGHSVEPDVNNLKIGIGNTGTEALSAFIANEFNLEAGAPKDKIEEQLESILLLHKLDHLLTDTGPKFVEARHDRGFRPSHSGHIWKIASKAQNTTPDGQKKSEPLPVLPVLLAEKLHLLNIAQLAYDDATHTIETLREQLYHDWYKYMITAYPSDSGRSQYPDSDRIRYFIENYSFTELQDLVSATGKLTIDANQIPSAAASLTVDYASKVYTAWSVLNALLTTENIDRTAKHQSSLSASISPGPRYWESGQPVVLISGLESTKDDHFQPNKENIPNYLTTSVVQSSLNINNLDKEQTSVKGFFTGCFEGQIDVPSLTEQHWNPFLLDWEIDLVDTDFQDKNGAYSVDGLKTNFTVNPFSPEFQKENYSKGRTSVFAGTAMMSTHAKPAMLSNLFQFIDRYIDKNKVKFSSGNSLTNFLIAVTATAAINTLKTKSKANLTANSPFIVAQQSYHWLMNNKVITQSLGGFNKASIMLHQTPQLPIEEPLGFDDSKDFTGKAKDLIQSYKHTSPILGFDFNPIRSGGLSLNRLQLVDNFGLSTELSTTTPPVASETLKDSNGNLFLHPRLAQAARLNFRWLSAEPVSEEENQIADKIVTSETNDHPITSPVCGWIMANYFNNGSGANGSIAAEANILGVYDADGKALGYLDNNAEWNLMPWINGPCDVNVNIENQSLRNLVSTLISTFKTNFSDFITATKIGLENVAPHNENLFNVKSILMGRPMAVVRSRVSFQTKGKPAIDQSWSGLLIDLDNCDKLPNYGYDNRNNNNWTATKLPVRIGEHHQLNDGVVAYWTEDKTGKLVKLYAPETPSEDVSNASIDTFNGVNGEAQWLSLEDEPLNLTILMDPRGVAHATSGLLPTKNISIPPQFYMEAMNNLNMWFAISPLLQPEKDRLVQNLPAISGYEWKWWDHFNGTYSIMPDSSKKDNDSKHRIIEGWLQLIPDTNN